MKQMFLVAITLFASLSSFSQGNSAYWQAYYNRKNDPETWKKVSNMSEKELETLSAPKQEVKKPVDPNSIKGAIGLNFGLNNTVGFEILGGREAIFGFGMNYFIGQGPVGEEYTTFHWSKYAGDVYQHITRPNAAFYGIFGYRVTPKLTVQSNIGVGTSLTYHNAVDRFGILGNGGYYYTSSDAGTTLLYGGSAQYEVNKFGVMVGYDNFAGGKFGITYSL